MNYIDPWGEDWLDASANYAAGFGDTITWGATNWAREQMGTNSGVDECSGAYSAGEWSGYAWEAGMMGAGAGAAFKGSLSNSKWLGKGSKLFGRSKFTASGKSGFFNKGSFRMGWGWKGSAKSGKDIFRASWSKPANRSYWNHIDWF